MTENIELIEDITPVENAYVYDATDEQRVFIEIENDDFISQYTQVFQPFNETLPEYDHLREVYLSGDGGDQQLETASEVADNYFFETNCVNLEGIEGDLPDNWKSEIDLDERQAGIGRLLAVKVLKDSDQPKITKKRSFGASDQPTKNRVRLLSTFNKYEVETAINFKPKRPSDISKYNRLKSRIGLKEGKGFDNTKIKIPAQIAAKAAIAEELGYTSEGYRDGIVPLHHLALAVTDYFDRSIKTSKKKSNY